MKKNSSEPSYLFKYFHYLQAFHKFTKLFCLQSLKLLHDTVSLFLVNASCNKENIDQVMLLFKAYNCYLLVCKNLTVDRDNVDSRM